MDLVKSSRREPKVFQGVSRNPIPAQCDFDKYWIPAFAPSVDKNRMPMDGGVLYPAGSGGM